MQPWTFSNCSIQAQSTSKSMNRIQYTCPACIDEAISLLNEPGVNSRVLAGGTDLMIELRANPDLCERVVDISLIPELHVIRREGDEVWIGAGATFSEVMKSPLVVETAPLLVQACRQVGAVQIRNIGTLGGNVCNAAACADSLPVLVCLDAVAHVRTAQGEEVWPVSELVVGANQTRVPEGGLLVTFIYRVPHRSSQSIFLKLGRRNAMAISRLTVATLGRLDEDGRIAEARIVPGAVAPQTKRIHAAEEMLVGEQPSQALFASAAQRVAQEVIAMAGWRWSSEFKQSALLAMTERALNAVFTVVEPAALEGA
jgi:CO/xanthine dehydrogenase FAD-binding subunit